jgi:hypothetical protein
MRKFSDKGCFNDDYTDDFHKCGKANEPYYAWDEFDLTELPAPAPKKDRSLLYLLIGMAFWFALLVFLFGCTSSKRVPYKNSCGIQMIG